MEIPRACFLVATMTGKFQAHADFKSVDSMGNSDNRSSTESRPQSHESVSVSLVGAGQMESQSGAGPANVVRLFRWLGIALIVALLFPGLAFVHRYWKAAKENWYVSQCRELRSARKWADLRRISEQWSAWDPSAIDAKLFDADASTHLQDFAAAAELLSSIPESHPKSLPSLVALSTMQFGPLGRPLDGARTCERILRIDHRATAAHQQLIEFYAVTLQRRKLEQQIRYAIDCSREPPKAYIYLFLMDTMRIAGASESNSRWLEQAAGSELFEVARVLHMPEPDNGVKSPSGDDKYSLADALLRRFPHNLEVLAYKVDVSLRSGDIQEVMALLSSLPAEADDDNRFWRAKGWLHLNRNELEKAQEALDHAISLFRMDWSARNLLADVLRKTGRLIEAEKLHELVQAARKLRTQINAIALDSDIPHEILSELASLANQCGDVQVSDSLNRRLGQTAPISGSAIDVDGHKTAK